MSELVKIIDAYKDAHGQPSDASIARAIGVASQTVNSWRNRGIKKPPAVDTLKRLAALTGLPYKEYVLQAALFDASWIDEMPPRPRPPEPQAKRGSA